MKTDKLQPANRYWLSMAPEGVSFDLELPNGEMAVIYVKDCQMWWPLDTMLKALGLPQEVPWGVVPDGMRAKRIFKGGLDSGVDLSGWMSNFAKGDPARKLSVSTHGLLRLMGEPGASQQAGKILRKWMLEDGFTRRELLRAEADMFGQPRGGEVEHGFERHAVRMLKDADGRLWTHAADACHILGYNDATPAPDLGGTYQRFSFPGARGKMASALFADADALVRLINNSPCEAVARRFREWALAESARMSTEGLAKAAARKLLEGYRDKPAPAVDEDARLEERIRALEERLRQREEMLERIGAVLLGRDARPACAATTQGDKHEAN